MTKVTEIREKVLTTKSEAKKASTVLDSTKVIPFSRMDTSKRLVEPHKFFHKSRSLCSNKRVQVLTERVPSKNWPTEKILTRDKSELMRQDDEAKHFFVMQRRCNCNHQIPQENL